MSFEETLIERGRPLPEVLPGRKIALVARNAVNVAPLQWALREHPELWNQNTKRTEHAESPHHGLSDIWVRWAPHGADPSQAHKSVWWPAAEVIAPVYGAVAATITAVGWKQPVIGGVLITKIPAGKMCKPHVDGGWHAAEYEKFGLQIESAPGQKFCFDGEELESRPGDVFWFDNSHKHWVTNDTEYDRITMIVCLKRG